MEQYDTVRQSPVMIKQKKPMSRGIKVGLMVLILFLGLSLLTVVGISVYVGWNLTHPEKMPVDTDPAHLGLDYEDIEVTSRFDQVLLSGWKIESKADPKGVIVMAHGYRKNRLQPEVPALSLAKDIVDGQYHVILFDFRNSGESTGTLTTVGHHEKEDLVSVVQYAKKQYPDLPIGVVGFSMGASTSIVAAGEAPSIKAVVADSPFADLRDYLQGNLSHWSNLPEFPFTPTIMTLLPMITGIDMDQVSPREAIQHTSAPLLLIHGDGDQSIPFQNSREIMSYSHNQKASLWIPEGSGHVKGYVDYPEEYKQRVLQFLNQSLAQ